MSQAAGWVLLGCLVFAGGLVIGWCLVDRWRAGRAQPPRFHEPTPLELARDGHHVAARIQVEEQRRRAELGEGNGLWECRPEIGQPFYPIVAPAGTRILHPGTRRARLVEQPDTSAYLVQQLERAWANRCDVADVLDSRVTQYVPIVHDAMGPPLPPHLRTRQNEPGDTPPVGWNRKRNHKEPEA